MTTSPISTAAPSYGAAGSGNPVLRSPVLAGVLDSALSAAAVRWAAAEASSLGVPLELLHAWSWQPVLPWNTSLDSDIAATLRHRSESILAECRSFAVEAGAREVRVESIEGGPVDVLAHAADRAAVLVLGSHPTPPLTTLVLGSMGSTLAGRATCPVVIVRPSPAPSQAGARPMVVIGIDIAHDDGRLLHQGFDYASRHGLGARVVTCWRGHGARQTPAPHEVHVRFSEYVSRWRDDYPDLPVELKVLRGSPRDVLVNESASAELLVIGRRRARTHLPEVLSAVTQHVIREAQCSIMIVAPHADVDPSDVNPSDADSSAR